MKATMESDNKESLDKFLDEFCFIANDEDEDNEGDLNQPLKKFIKISSMLANSTKN